MYTITNQKTAIIKNLREQVNFDYFDLCSTAVGSTPAQGLDMAGITERVSLLDAFRKKTGPIKIDDDQYKSLVEAIKTCRWRIVHPDLVTFSTYINGLTPSKK